MLQVILWWLLVSALGWLSLPLAGWLFPRLPDRGYALSRALGLLIASYLLWLGTSLGLLHNDLGGITLTLLTLAGLSAWRLFGPAKAWKEWKAFLCERRSLVLTGELLFALAFVAWALLRAYAVDKVMPAGGEKFMESAFLNGILRSRTFPPLDPWLSGYAISYYYFGYVMMALLTRLSGALSTVAFDLYDALLLALSALGAFGLVYNLTAADPPLAGSAGPARRLRPTSAGLLGALFTVGLGNLQGALEALYSKGWLPFDLAEWLGVPGFPLQAAPTGTFDPGSFWGWAWRSSRVVNDLGLDGQPLALQPITEFPAFSFLLGDNHPHLLALPFALLAAQVAFHLLRSGLDDAREAHARLAVFAWIVASLLFLNTWDFPIYLALAVLAWLAGHSLAAGRLGRAQWVQALCLGVGMLLGGVLAYTLFLVSFSSQAGGVLPYLFPPTRLTQYLIMFGPFVVILGGFLLTALIIENHGPGRPFSTRGLAWGWLRFAAGCALAFLGLVVLTGLALWVDGFRSGHLAASLLPYLGGESFPAVALQVLAQRLSHPWLFLLLTALLFLALAGLARALRAARANEDLAPIPASPGRLFAWLLALLGLALTFSVEFVYLRDDFGVRMNTVFKFYFQGWVLMAAASAYALVWMAAHAGQALKRWQHNLYRGLSLAVVLGGLAFPILGVFSRTEGFRAAPNLDSTVNLRRDHPDDWAVIDWLNANSDASGQVPRLLEAPGHSYNYEGRISAFTGLPTVLGWSLHEAQWRGNYDEQGRREPLIAQIYTSADPATALQLLRSLGVDFVVLGDPERAYIREQCAQANPPCDPMAAEAKFTQALPLAFQQGQTNLYAVPPVP